MSHFSLTSPYSVAKCYYDNSDFTTQLFDALNTQDMHELFEAYKALPIVDPFLHSTVRDLDFYEGMKYLIVEIFGGNNIEYHLGIFAISAHLEYFLFSEVSISSIKQAIGQSNSQISKTMNVKNRNSDFTFGLSDNKIIVRVCETGKKNPIWNYLIDISTLVKPSKYNGTEQLPEIPVRLLINTNFIYDKIWPLKEITPEFIFDLLEKDAQNSPVFSYL